MPHNGLGAHHTVFNASSDTLLESDPRNPLYLKLERDNVKYDEAVEEEERLLLGGLQSKRPRSVIWRIMSFFKSPIGIIVALGGLMLVLLLSVAANINEEWDTKVRGSLSSLQEKVNQGIQRVQDGPLKSCEDPWATPGYIWYGDHRFDARWISYKDFSEDVLNKDASKSVDPAKTGPRPAKEAPHLNQLPMQYTKAFSQKNIRTNNTDLDFLRNKHIVVLGSSLDREATMMFCNAYEGAAPADLKWHHSLRCRFPDYNLTISQWMHFGMAETTYHRGGDKFSKEHNFEDRVDQIFTKMAEKDGKPDLLVFTSGFWDLQYLDQHLHRIDHTHPVGKKFPMVRSDQLKWHRARLTQAIQHLRLRFPDSYLMYRTTTEPDRARTSGDEEGTAVFQLNQSARTVMKKLKVPLFHWADIVKGNHEHRDVHHFNTVSRANAVYHEMLFWHLKQVSLPKVDTSCWLDR